ncbi:MAG: Holliday junction branch migration protein RuvA [Patescibacteria group bacterium]|jgi:Holliday junction DNA helicase RuvA
MISFLRGRVINKGLNYAIIETGNIGYQVFAGENFLNDLKIDNEVEIYTHHQVREEASDLYGFKTLEDLELFELLLTVSGVGPKSALGVLTIASASDIKEAIIRGDANLLTKVSGIGKKTAERLVLELKTKILRFSSTATTDNSSLVGSDEIEALMSLGYSFSEARSALNLVDSAIIDSGERVKAALRKIAKK